MKTDNYKIFIIDDDKSVCRSISLLLNSAGYETESFYDVTEFFETVEHSGTGCILLDVFLDGNSTLDIQAEIDCNFCHLPIIFMTGLGNIPMSVKALKQGAINFLQKPISEEDLLKAVEEAKSLSWTLQEKQNEKNRIRTLINTLTPREYEIYLRIITGMLNKQIAAELNIAEHTVKLHRGKITEKLGVKSIAEIVQMADKLDIPVSAAPH
jgi:FixJ family two-component response regulator